VRTLPDWAVLPAFEVSESRYRTSSGSVVLCIVPKLSYEIMMSKNILITLHERDFAQLAMKVSRNAIHGRLIYMKPPDGVSRSARVELKVQRKRTKTFVIRKLLAKLKNPETPEFSYQLPRIEDLRLKLAFTHI